MKSPVSSTLEESFASAIVNGLPASALRDTCDGQITMTLCFFANSFSRKQAELTRS